MSTLDDVRRGALWAVSRLAESYNLHALHVLELWDLSLAMSTDALDGSYRTASMK